MSLINRRDFIGTAVTGASALGLAGASFAPTRVVAASSASALPAMRMKAGHQHDHTPTTLRALAAFGVKNICSGKVGRGLGDGWSVDDLKRLRQHVESFGIALDCVPLPLSAAYITEGEHPEVLLDKNPERDRTLELLGQMIRNCGAAGIPMVKYNLTFIGVVRTGTKVGRGGATLKSFDYSQLKPGAEMTPAGRITEEIYWDRIGTFLKKIVPIAEEAKVKIACHPQDPGMPPETGWRGVNTVLGTPAGLVKFVEMQSSAYHGLNFCQGTVAEMLPKPNEQIYDVIRDFGRRGKIFNVHFRNIRGGYLNFDETMPDDGDVDMPKALRVYQEFGYDGMVMPDHVPHIEGDTGGHKAFAFCHGYIQALLQQLRAEGSTHT
ncbi:MAG: mannonate dehydratase [Opitutaceae bacterium]